VHALLDPDQQVTRPDAAFCFTGFSGHNFAENGPWYLKMVMKDVSGNSTQSVVKISF
jgi:hypothetical protein